MDIQLVNASLTNCMNNLIQAILDHETLFRQCPENVQSAIKLYVASEHFYSLGDGKKGQIFEDEAFKALRKQTRFEEPEVRRDYVPRRFQELE